MSQRQTVEAALAAWRDAERRLAQAADGEADVLTREVGLHRDEYQRLSAANMVEWMAKKEQRVDGRDDRIAEYQVNMMVTFILDD